MKSRPLLMKGPLVVASLEDRKTETRRLRGLDVVNKVPEQWDWQAITQSDVAIARFIHLRDGKHFDIRCPYGKPGDRLWIREKVRAEELPSGQDGVRYLADDAFISIPNTEGASDLWGDLYWYRAKKREDGLGKTVPSIHMPCWACRLEVEILEIRIERVQAITKTGAIAEGIEGFGEARASSEILLEYFKLWDSINAKKGFSVGFNPWVWVVKYRRIV